MVKRLIPEQQEVDFAGERVSHLFPNDCYFAHLSIYHFASQYSAGKVVLDSGCGAGYGSNYFADHGALSVTAIDISQEAVDFSNRHFSAPNLSYQVMDLQNITSFQPNSFDLIFSSNALEHVPELRPFFHRSWELLKPGGTLVIAVPPVVDEISLKNNLENRYHLNIWSPRQWYALLSQYFESVQAYQHGFDKPGIQLDFNNTVEQTRVSETDFLFEPISLDDFYKKHTLTVIFVASKPRPANRIPSPQLPLRFVDESFTRQMDGTIIASKKPSFIEILKKGWLILRKEGPRKAARAGLRYFKRVIQR